MVDLLSCRLDVAFPLCQEAAWPWRTIRHFPTSGNSCRTSSTISDDDTRCLAPIRQRVQGSQNTLLGATAKSRATISLLDFAYLTLAAELSVDLSPTLS